MPIRSQIPAVEGIDDPHVAAILTAMKSKLEKITGSTPNSPQIKALAGSANIGGVVAKLNEVINRLQDTDVAGAPTQMSGQYQTREAYAWGLVSFAAGSPTLVAGTGISSVTDTAQGRTAINLSKPTANTKYAASATVESPAGAQAGCMIEDGKTINTFIVNTFQYTTDAPANTDLTFSVVVFA